MHGLQDKFKNRCIGQYAWPGPQDPARNCSGKLFEPLNRMGEVRTSMDKVLAV